MPAPARHVASNQKSEDFACRYVKRRVVCRRCIDIAERASAMSCLCWHHVVGARADASVRVTLCDIASTEACIPERFVINECRKTIERGCDGDEGHEGDGEDG